MVESFDTAENFWVVHPGFKSLGPFKKLYSKDKTRGKDRSSRLAWTIKSIWHRKSEIYNLPETGEDNKIDLAFEDIYGDTKYYEKNKEEIEELRDFYINCTTTPAARTLMSIEEKLKERDAFIRETPYDLGEKGERGYLWGTVDTLDKMMANTEKLYIHYDKARKTVEQEESQTSKGGGIESLSDNEAI